eukprot:TRINITY_DN11753_c0_g2_i1.p1 TRINITY_DN11753_c0_g2~~TRINITY_DN11753_c0_g2_i1.p1  ORF type:complete len:1133 (-),score=301.10 TRINITY_DN11753_c0_g2_i1:30-3428(-)
MDPLSLLGKDLFQYALFFLEAKSLSQICQVSKAWNSQASADILWKVLYEETWPSGEDQVWRKYTEEPISWKHCFLSSLKAVSNRILRHKCNCHVVVLIGDSGVGKTEIINNGLQTLDETPEGRAMLINDIAEDAIVPKKAAPPLPEGLMPTSWSTCSMLAVPFNTKNNKDTLLLFVQDTTSDKDDIDTRRKLVHTDAVFAVYDVSRRETFENLKNYWIPEIRSKTRRVPIILVGNKFDLPSTVTDVEIEALIVEHQIELHLPCESRDNAYDVFQKAVFIQLPITPILNRATASFEPMMNAFLARLFEKLAKGSAHMNAMQYCDFQQQLGNSDFDQQSFEYLKKEMSQIDPWSFANEGLTYAGFMTLMFSLFKQAPDEIFHVLQAYGFKELLFETFYPRNLHRESHPMPTTDVELTEYLTEHNFVSLKSKFDEAHAMSLTCLERINTTRYDSCVHYIFGQGLMTSLATTGEPLRHFLFNHDVLDTLNLLLRTRAYGYALGCLSDLACSQTEYLLIIANCPGIFPALKHILENPKHRLINYTLAVIGGLARHEFVRDLLIEQGIMLLIIQTVTSIAETNPESDALTGVFEVYSPFARSLNKDHWKHVFTKETVQFIFKQAKGPNAREALALTYLLAQTAPLIPLLIEEGLGVLTEIALCGRPPANNSAAQCITQLINSTSSNDDLKAIVADENALMSLRQLILESDGDMVFAGLIGLAKLTEFDWTHPFILSSNSEILESVIDVSLTERGDEAAAWAGTILVQLASNENILRQILSELRQRSKNNTHLETIARCLSMLASTATVRENLIKAGVLEFLEDMLQGSFKDVAQQHKMYVSVFGCVGYLAVENEVRMQISKSKLYELAKKQSKSDDEAVRFCALWALSCCDSSPEERFKNAPAVHLDENTATSSLKLSADGLEMRNDSMSFESVRSTHLAKIGKWYYEVTILTEGVFQIGWAAEKAVFDSKEGTGVGDDYFSFSADLNRLKKWHGGSRPYGTKKWKVGDVVGCYLNLDGKSMSFSLNGENFGVAFSNVGAAEGLFAAVSASMKQQCRFNFGQTPFRFSPVLNGVKYMPFASVATDTFTREVVDMTAENLRAEVERTKSRLRRTNIVNVGLGVALCAAVAFAFAKRYRT